MTKTNLQSILLDSISTKNATIGIMGIGAVGKTLGECFVNSGFKTIGFDIDKKKIQVINSLSKTLFFATEKFSLLTECDIICILVPTPITKNFKPELQALIEATKTVSTFLRKGQLIIVESTIAPGTTREVVLPLLKKSGLLVEKDFFLGYSPQRIDFGNPKYSIKTIPKVVSGFSNRSKKLVKSFYLKCIDKVILVSTIENAELCKILENTYRFVNINLINEIQEYAVKKKIDLIETINAAKTKPFGFFPFYPSAGISGHCIPVDPYYLLQDAQKHQVSLEILKTCMNFHKKRIQKITNKIFSILKKEKKLNKKILIIGITTKPDSDDLRESVALKIWKQAEKRKAEVFYHDPYISSLSEKQSLSLNKKTLKNIDIIVIITNHKNIDYDLILASKKPIIDTKNIYKENNEKIYKV